jgi:hypothetical protein
MKVQQFDIVADLDEFDEFRLALPFPARKPN